MTQGRTGRKPTEKGRAESRRKRNGILSGTARQAVVKNDALRPGRREMSDRFPQEKPFPLFSFAFVSCIMIHEKVCAVSENARRRRQRDNMRTFRSAAGTKRQSEHLPADGRGKDRRRPGRGTVAFCPEKGGCGSEKRIRQNPDHRSRITDATDKKQSKERPHETQGDAARTAGAGRIV